MWKIEKLRKNSTFNHIFRQEMIALKVPERITVKKKRASFHFSLHIFPKCTKCTLVSFLPASLEALKANTRRLYNAILMRHT
jgi:hypothetical protein